MEDRFKKQKDDYMMHLTKRKDTKNTDPNAIKDEECDDIKAVRREVINVYSKGTYNPGPSTEEQLEWVKKCGKQRFKEEELEEGAY